MNVEWYLIMFRVEMWPVISTRKNIEELIFIQNGALLHFAIVVREWRDGVVIRASASQSVDLGFIS